MRKKTFLSQAVIAVALTGMVGNIANAVLITDPNDPRTFLGASVGTFAQHFFGADTPANRQMVVDSQLLDDGVFNPTGFVTGQLVATPWALGTGGSASHNAGLSRGQSTDLTGTGGFGFVINNGLSVFQAANGIDNLWFQSSDTPGDTVFDLGFQATKAAVFNTVDHGPLPQEVIESTVYLSNDQINWTQAVVERIWLEGFQPNLGIEWDGYVFAVGTGTNSTFRFASTTWGGPGALIADGDDEMNGIMGLGGNFEPQPTNPNNGVPEPLSATLGLLGVGVLGASVRRRRSA